MFTGLIEAVGRVAGIDGTTDRVRLRIRTELADQLTPGESVAVNGVCLTVAGVSEREAGFDVGPETARITTLGLLRADLPVNLERAMRADDRFGGHFVQGHVDGTGTITNLWTEGEARWISIAFPSELGPYLVRKGSIAVDGISLTVAVLADDHFDVMIIPFTWEHTNLSALQVGSRVNLECDMVGKYVARAVALFRSP